MRIHVAMVGLLALLLSDAAPAQTDAELDGAVAAEIERDLIVGRHYVGRGDYTAAIGRLKPMQLRDQSSRHVDEALARIAEAYLALGINWEAQTAAAVLARKYPNSRWSAMAADAVKSAGLEPLEDSRSWIGQIFK